MAKKAKRFNGVNLFGYLAGLLFFAGTQVALYTYVTYKQFPLGPRVAIDLIAMSAVSGGAYLLKESDKITETQNRY